MPLLESSNPTAVGLEKCNIAERQDKDLKIAIMFMLKNIKHGIHKSINEIHETN